MVCNGELAGSSTDGDGSANTGFVRQGDFCQGGSWMYSEASPVERAAVKTAAETRLSQNL